MSEPLVYQDAGRQPDQEPACEIEEPNPADPLAGAALWIPPDWNAYFEGLAAGAREAGERIARAFKVSATVPVSIDLLMDMGVIPDTRPPSPPPPWRPRFRWWRQAKREALAVWMYERVSGAEFPEEG